MDEGDRPPVVPAHGRRRTAPGGLGEALGELSQGPRRWEGTQVPPAGVPGGVVEGLREEDGRRRVADRQLALAELRLEICCVGSTHATPVSDGRDVYVATSLDSFACFDLDGKLKLAAARARSARRILPLRPQPAAVEGFCSSPTRATFCAFDKATGKLLGATPGADEVTSPTVFRVAGVDYLLVAGIGAYRLPDGKAVPVEGWGDARPGDGDEA